MNEASLATLVADLGAGGLRGSFLARDLTTGVEVGFDQDAVRPCASLVKIPLAVTVLDRFERGDLDPQTPVSIEPPAERHPGPPGLSRFRHRATVALEDLLYLSVSLSDNVATDALFGVVPPGDVEAQMRRLGIDAIAVRHRTDELLQTPAERLDRADVDLAHRLAVHSSTEGGGHRIPQLDTTRANTGSASSFVDLLELLWRPSAIAARSAEHLRSLMAANVHRQRLAPDFVSDGSRWYSKTGTLLNLRHEIAVVEHDDGQTIAIAALTESSIAAVEQPAAEALIAATARALHDHLRRG